MDLNNRMEILLSSNTISNDVFDTVKKVITRMDDHWNITLTEDNGGRLVTHLSMALMRIFKGEPVAAMEPDIYEEFQESDEFEKAVSITADLISWAELTIPTSEEEYLNTNICLIL